MEQIRNDASLVFQLLSTVDIAQRFVTPRKLGILNGFVDQSDPSEKPCTEYMYTSFRSEDWEERFRQLSKARGDKYEVERIPVSKVSDEYAVVINPFGEVYPEKDLKKRSSFGLLRSYLEDGGLLVNVAGFPFFYAWNVVEGRKEPIVDERVIIPATARIEGTKFFVEQFTTLLSFAGSLLWRELDAITTANTPQVAEPKETDTYQNDEDKKMAGELSSVGGGSSVHEFRAIRKETRGLVPLLRASHPDFGEVYPVAGIHRGFGYLIVGGMHTKTSAEFEKLVVAIDNFSDWLSESASQGSLP